MLTGGYTSMPPVFINIRLLGPYLYQPHDNQLNAHRFYQSRLLIERFAFHSLLVILTNDPKANPIYAFILINEVAMDWGTSPNQIYYEKIVLLQIRSCGLIIIYCIIILVSGLHGR